MDKRATSALMAVLSLLMAATGLCLFAFDAWSYLHVTDRIEVVGLAEVGS